MRHSDKKHSIRLLTALLSALPLTAGAAGLGKLTVQSAIGQALRAEVELSATAEELASMTARLAPPSAFKQAGVDFASSLSGVKVAVDKRGARPVLIVTSDRAVNEPFLDVLIELNWASGRLVREYTFLLDPADMPRPAPVEPSVVKDVAPRAAPVARAPAPPAPADGAYEIRRGDTLNRIANQYKPAGVSLDQMLVALVRANPDAFDGGNMNRMRAGRILAIPDQAAAESVAPQEARKIVSAQTTDFAAYRARLAGAVADIPPTGDAGSRAASGRIEPRVDDRAPATAASSDQVRVSKSAAGSDGRLTALEEEVIAKERALKDANSRLAELERNVRELQQMVEVKSSPMAAAQKTASAPTVTAVEPAPVLPPVATAVPAPADKPVPDLVAGAEGKSEAKPVPDLVDLAGKESDAKPAAEQPKEEPAPPPAPAPAVEPAPAPEAEVAEEQGMFADPKTLAGLGGIALLLLGYLGFRKYKAREASPEGPPSTTAGMESEPAAASVIGAMGGGQSVDTSASSIQTDFSQSSLSSIDADEGVDPVAEADVYMAYGRDAQAEEILLEALKTEPSRHAIHLKLLEIYAQRKSIKPFEALATELYAQTGGKGADWEKAALLGRSVDPSNPLYGGGEEVHAQSQLDEQAAMAATVVVSGADKMRDTWTLPGDIDQLASGSEPTMALDLNKIEQAVSAAQGSPAETDLDFDLDVPAADSVLDLPPVGVATTLTKPGEESEGESSLDFDLGLDFVSDATAKNVSTVTLEKNVADTAEAMAQSGSQGFDLDLSLPADDGASGAVVDLERTDVGNLIDFNFDAAESPEQRQGDPVIDLSDINLDLGTDVSALETDIVGDATLAAHALETDIVGDASHVLETDVVGDAAHMLETEIAGDVTASLDDDVRSPLPDLDDAAVSTVINPEDMLANEEPPQTAAEEAETKLELARAYEEMGDKEGARELLQEVVREGTAEQQSLASDMLTRLG
ncbi:MAG: pilus assembly protein [Methyloversatilis sp.]|nr:pilus assembly protein [Methyloversatilis sp.]MBP6194196.1 pilus assembly protein [Methyloversatilis sp.]MBP9118076.1 pilus assembly protein [Methyloversatilis sp.]